MPIPVMPDSVKPFQLETNASSLRIRVVITQDVKLLAFFSEKLSTIR